jgi:hypothetical protein
METVDKDGKGKFTPFETWLAWAGGSFLAGICALVLSIAIVRWSGANEDRWMIPVLVPALVVFLGVAQALVLSMRLQRAAWWWVGVTAAGCGLSILILLLISTLGSNGNLNPAGITITLALMIYGACTGIAQWLYLRRRWSRAIWWVPASIIGWALPGIIVGQVFTSPIQITLVGLLPASVTGLLVAWWFSGSSN